MQLFSARALNLFSEKYLKYKFYQCIELRGSPGVILGASPLYIHTTGARNIALSENKHCEGSCELLRQET